MNNQQVWKLVSLRGKQSQSWEVGWYYCNLYFMLNVRTKIKASKALPLYLLPQREVFEYFHVICSTALSEPCTVSSMECRSKEMEIIWLPNSCCSSLFHKQEGISQTVTSTNITIPIILSPQNPIYMWTLRNKYPTDHSHQRPSAKKPNEKASIDYSFSINSVSQVFYLQRTLARGLCLLAKDLFWMTVLGSVIF